MGDLNYAHEKYGAGLRLLATEDKRLRERLIDAVAEALHADESTDQHAGPAMNEDLVQLLADFRADATAAGPGPNGSIHKTLAALNDDEVREFAERFLAVEYQLDEAWQERRWS